MLRRYVYAAIGAAVVATIVGGVAAYLMYRLTTGDGRTYVTLAGPLDGWHTTWLMASLAAFAVALPSALYHTYKQGPGPAPGGAMVSSGVEDDLTFLRQVADWVEKHDELATASAPGDRVYPPCLRCGRQVNGYRAKPHAMVLMRFKPCGCRVILSRRHRRDLKAAGVRG